MRKEEQRKVGQESEVSRRIRELEEEIERAETAEEMLELERRIREI